jgi:hypothetical protein
MFNTNTKDTGTQYTLTAMLLLLAFVFTPFILILSRPFGVLSVGLALAFSAGCSVLAWLAWTRFSRLTIPSLNQPSRRRQ